MNKQDKTKQRKGRYSYLNDFKLNEDNEYEYQGNVYELELSTADSKTVFRNIVICCGLLLAVIIAGGCLPYQAMRGTFYVIIPYVFEVIFVCLLLPCVYTIVTNVTLRDYQYRKSVDRIRPYCGVIMINAVIGLFATALYLTISGTSEFIVPLIYLLCKVLAFFLAKELVRRYGTLSYKKIREKEVVID